MLWLIWLVTICVALLLYFREHYSRFAKHGVKHTTPVPIFGDSARIFFKIEHFAENIQRLYNAFPTERFIGSYEQRYPVIMVRDLELVKKVTVKDFEHFVDHRPFLDEEADPLFTSSLFSLKGQKWKDMRSTLSPAFTSSKIRLMIPFIEEVANQMIESVKQEMEANKAEFVDIQCNDLITRYANDVIASCAFGLKINSQVDKRNQFFEMARISTQFTAKTILKFFVMGAFPTISKKLKLALFSENVQNYFRKLVHATMEDRDKQNIKRNDMIQLLMEAKKGSLTHDSSVTNDNDAGFATVEESEIGKNVVTRVWSDDDLTAQALLFVLAGFDTVSKVMTLLFFELATNPEIQDRLVQEVRECRKNHGDRLNYETIQKMVYLDMVVSETLRKWPPTIMTHRVCTKDYNLGKPNNDVRKDYVIREGEGVTIPIWAIHRSPEYYPDPDKFDPERFSDENKHKINPFTYLPFGIGPRNCIGSRFALCEIKVIMYHLLQHFEIMPCEKTCLPIRLSNENQFALLIKGGHWLRLKMRNDS